MSRSHGKKTIFTVDGNDLSRHTKNSGWESTLDAEDTTCYGVDDHEYDISLGDGKFTADGVYDTASTGPRTVLQGIQDDQKSGAKGLVTVVRRIEGTGSGKPQETFSAIVTKYGETSASTGYVMWSAEFQKSGAVNRTAQA